MTEKRGHVVWIWQLETEENGVSLLDHEAITSDGSGPGGIPGEGSARLQRLVAELLVKNEQLRQLYLASLTTAD